jgi:hypothetical protein
MKPEIEKRGAYLHVGRPQFGVPVPVGKKPVWITGYSKSDEFVCRLEISAAGIAVFTGRKGRKSLGDWTWEKFVQDLEKLKSNVR